jgi:hypothetical protein
MPRLTDTDYLEAHYYLKEAWKAHQGVAFGLLLWHEQRALHDYFLLSKRMSDKALLDHRQLITKSHSSLPHRAGKALARCRANVQEFNARPPVPYVPGSKRKRPKGERHIVVSGIAVADFDPKRLAELAIQIKREEHIRGH